MNLQLKRNEFTDESSIGELILPAPVFVTLEDTDRGLKKDLPLEGIKALKIAGKTAIPYGTYEVGISYSNRFKKMLPILFNVPGFEGIRIHSGNTAEDTEGCILLALDNPEVENWVYDSRDAMDIFMPWLKATLEREKVFLEIVK